MEAVKPVKRSEAKVYIGRHIKKPFVDPKGDGRKKRLFSGTVVDIPIFGEVCYTIEYEDGDREDIAWEELMQILVPDTNAKGAGEAGGRLADRTNTQALTARADTEGQAAKHQRASNMGIAPGDEEARPQRQRRSSVKRPLTDDTDDDAAAHDGCGDQPQLQQPGRRMRMWPGTERDGSSSEGDGDHGGAAAPQRQANSRRDGQGARAHPQQEPDLEAEAPEAARPRKRPTKAPARDAEELQPENPAEQARNHLVSEPASGAFQARRDGTAGHLKRIHVENFMCHANMEVKFGTHVTLVSGQNGSGKSAVMQALQVCLGATARETGRGTSLPGFIKDELPDARVRVTLWNKGDEAYQHHIYGDTITIERRIVRSGATTWAILDHHGRKAKLKSHSQERDLILTYFGIDAGNPLVIITQDKSRMFLSGTGKNGKDNTEAFYNMFMEGTLLAQIEELDAKTTKKVTVMEDQARAAAATLAQAREEHDQLNKRLQKLRSSDTLLEQREVLERALAWSGVADLEADLAAAQRRLEEQLPRLVAMHQELLDTCARDREAAAAQEAELKAEYAQYEAAVNGYREHAKALFRAELDARKTRERAERDRATALAALQQLKDEEAALQQKLSQENNAQAAEARRAVEAHQRLVTEKQEALQKAAEAVTAAQQALEAAQNEAHASQQDEYAKRKEIVAMQRTVQGLQNEIHRLSADQGNRLAIFGGQSAITLAAMINQQVLNFRQRPIGPIGMYLTVNDPMWIMGAEVAIGHCFCDYIVTCAADAVLLRDMMRAANYRAAVITSPFDTPPHNIPLARRPTNGFASMLDMLTVNDAAARTPILNLLVDKFRVESLALAPDGGAQGRAVIYQQAAGPHISVAIDMDGNVYKSNRGIKWIERVSTNRRQPRLVADMTAYLASLQHDLDVQEAKLSAEQGELTALAARVAAARQQAAQMDREHRAAMTRKSRAMTELNRAQASMPAMPDLAGDEETAAIMTQLQDTTTEMAQSQLQLQTATEALRCAIEAYKQAQEQAKAEQARLEEQIGQGTQLRDAMARVQESMAEIDNVAATARGLQQTAVDEVQQLQRAVGPAAEKVMAAVAAAEKVCDRAEGQAALLTARTNIRARIVLQLSNRQQRRDQAVANMRPEELHHVINKSVEASMSVAGLDKELARVAKEIAKAEKEAGGDREELVTKLAAAARELNTAEDTHRFVNSKARDFRDVLEKRLDRSAKLQDAVEKVTQSKFSMYLGRRDHTGRILIDHAARSLRLQIKPLGRRMPHAVAVEDLKQLSGGERSYTTVSFLLAVGHSTESPFRCMDEFDVYMDSINRRIATETLLEFAYDNPAFQYIFLTPQDLQAVEDARQVLMRRRKIELPAAFLSTLTMKPAKRPTAATHG